MTYRAHVRNGRVELDEPAELPEGMEVELRIVSAANSGGNGRSVEEKPLAGLSSLEEELDRIWADVPDSEWDKLPADMLDNLDHYIHGTPKR